MIVVTHIQAGAVNSNHNATLVVRAALKAGALNGNHNEGLRA